MKNLISIVSLCLCITTAQGQYVADALRFSQNFPTLTARSMSMGNAFTSLGGDFSSAYINPAGLGIYRKSELLFSPGLGYSNIKSNYLGQSFTDDQYQYINSSVGYVGTYNTFKDKGLVSASFAAGYNRLNNFYNNTIIQGTNDQSSYSDYFVENAYGLEPDALNPFYERLAFDAWVMDTMGGPNQYGSLVPVPIDQRKTIHTQGGIGEWSFAVGLNFSNILYIGTGIGIDQINYEQHAVQSETNYDGNWAFRGFDFDEDLDVKGTGINFKFGMLARVTNSLRVGATLFLPTYYNIEEVYYNTLYSEYNDSSFFIRPTNEYGDLLEAGAFAYNLNTPLKATGGLSFQIGKSGIVTGDVEFINYAGIKMSTDKYYNSSVERETIDQANAAIDNAYRSVFNFRLGGEFRMGNFALRAGGGYFPSPYASDELNKDASYTEITSGIGYRDKIFFFDLGFSGIFHKEKYNLYTSNNTDNIADLNQQSYRFIATMGVRF
jgi:hypothetical protein